MAKIIIKDLPENRDLDRKAMEAITGGARLRGAAPTGVVPLGGRVTERADRQRDTGHKASPRRPVPSMLFT